MAKCVEWRERDGNGMRDGLCVEVSRDAESWNAETLCGRHVALPGPSVRRVPTCSDCRALLEKRR